ncbi:hypothetical protein RHMOL_Rhmol01G0207400 [Rhododendron molle]|uniref:Uncharacterized protein n=1 Tax=Rhododendron molle TaxID=49168 RepID=A0ACC0Q3J6_RHOML|nr:hypothetical protein RHMOL_Rhmol01G0207400 [Rhododendron molle]
MDDSDVLAYGGWEGSVDDPRFGSEEFLKREWTYDMEIVGDKATKLDRVDEMGDDCEEKESVWPVELWICWDVV